VWWGGFFDAAHALGGVPLVVELTQRRLSPPVPGCRATTAGPDPTGPDPMRPNGDGEGAGGRGGLACARERASLGLPGCPLLRPTHPPDHRSKPCEIGHPARFTVRPYIGPKESYGNL